MCLGSRFPTNKIFTIISVVVLAMLATISIAYALPPGFSKSFAPSTIAVGGNSVLTLTIDNTAEATPTTALDFTDNLPAGVVIATPANASTTCTGGSLTAPNGGSTISYTNGDVGAGSFCTVTVSTTSSTGGMHTNLTGDLTSSQGNSGTATANLTVSTTLPSFSMAFLPTTTNLNGTSRLTYTIDNPASGSILTSLSFTNNLPAGIVVAPTPNATQSCGGTAQNFTANAGASTVSLSNSFGIVLAVNASCTASVDVLAGSIGTFVNSAELFSATSGSLVSSGFAIATLTVNPITDLTLTKSFTDDPVAPGQTVNLEFFIHNPDAVNDATAISFTDDLNAMLTGAVAIGLPINVCGGTLSGTSSLSFTGGSVAARSSCNFSLSVQVPAGATPNTYTNTTSQIAATLGGSPFTGTVATDDLVVTDSAGLTFSKAFTNDPVAPGATVDLEFTIINPNTTQAATDIAFTDNISAVISGMNASVLPAAGFCGVGSSIAQTEIGGSQHLSMTGGQLAANANCIFTVTLQLPAGTPGGTFPNVTNPVFATINGSTVEGGAASDDLVVDAPLNLTLLKEFSQDNAIPGSDVDITFTITNASDDVNATAVTFSDNLSGFHAGTISTGTLPSDPCGTGSSLTGGSTITLLAGSVDINDSCSFTVSVTLGPGTATPATNTTSDLMASPNGGTVETVTSSSATDTITIDNVLPVVLTKEFTDDPVIAGGTATLQFTITNPATNPTDATSIQFTDSLSSVLSGLVSSSGTTSNPCGTGSQIAGTSSLSFTGGSLTPGSSCNFSVTLQVPSGAVDGTYGNITSSITATINGGTIVGSPATDDLVVQSEILQFSKAFTDDPVTAGNSASLEFTITNSSLTQTVTSLTFTDNLDGALSGLVATGLPANNICGAGSTISGTSFLTLAAGSLAPGASCVFSVTTTVPAAAATGSYTNTTSALTGMVGVLDVSGNVASDQLQVISASAPTFTKQFPGSPVAAGNLTTIEFQISNPAGGASLSSLSLTDNLDAFLTGVVAVGLPLNDVCGTGSVLSGTSLVTLSGGNLSPGANCTITFSALIPATATADTFTNTTSDLTSSGLFVANAASGDLTIEPPPTFAKSFAPDTIFSGGTSTLTFTINNSASSLVASAMSFTDNMPAAITVAAPANASTTCTGGTLTAASGTSVISYTGGTVSASATCTVSVDVTSMTTGAHLNTTGDLTSSSGNSGTAADTLNVNANPNGDVTIVQNTDVDGAFTFTSTETLLTFVINTAGGTGQQGPISLPAGTYTVTQTRPSGVGNVSITCNDIDSTGDAASGVLTINLASSEMLVCTFVSSSSLQKTINTINRFLTKRTDLIVSNEPSNTRRINRLKRGASTVETLAYAPNSPSALLPFEFDPRSLGGTNYHVSTSLSKIKKSAANMTLAYAPEGTSIDIETSRFDIWFEGSYQRFSDSEDSKGHFAIGYLGMDYLVNPDLLIGALVQVDDMEDVSATQNTTTSGTGWFAGPYLTARLAPDFYLDARAAWGQSNNEVSPTNTHVDDFETTRWLANINLTGEFQSGPWQFRPNLSFSYIEEDQKAYIDSLNVLIPSQTVTLGQLRFGPNISTQFVDEYGNLIQPHFTFDGLFNFGDTSGVTVTNPSTVHSDGFRGRVEAGVSITSPDGKRLDITGNYDGIGQSEFEAYGGSVKVVIPLQ